MFRLGTLTAWNGQYNASDMGLSQFNLTRRFAGIINDNYGGLWGSLPSLTTGTESDFFGFFVRNGLPPSL